MNRRSTKVMCATFACSAWALGLVGLEQAGALSSTGKTQEAFCSDMAQVAKADAATLSDPTEQNVRHLASDVKVAAATVPPAEIAANRRQLINLISTNLLGHNAPAIAQAEMQYAEIWARDVAEMFGYSTGPSVSGVPVKLGPVASYVEHACPNSGDALKAIATSDHLHPTS